MYVNKLCIQLNSSAMIKDKLVKYNNYLFNNLCVKLILLSTYDLKNIKIPFYFQFYIPL